MADNPYKTTPYTTNPYQPYNYRSTQPVYPNINTDVPETPDPTGADKGGIVDWITSHLGDLGDYFKQHAGDITEGAGSAVGYYLDYETKQKALAQQKEQFEKQYGLQANTQAADVAGRLNRAPLADKGQYLAMNYTPPMPFQPRDYTQGLDQIRGQAQGGAAAQLAANNAAATKYAPGAGGVDTSVLKSILSRLNVGGPATPPVGGTGNTLPTGQSSGPPGGSGQLALGTASNTPTGAPSQPGPAVGNTPGDISSLSAKIQNTQYPPGFFPQGLPDKPPISVVAQEWQRLYGNAPMPPLGSNELANWWSAYRSAYNYSHGIR